VTGTYEANDRDEIVRIRKMTVAANGRLKSLSLTSVVHSVIVSPFHHAR
jgi:hypothetical protein